MPKFSEIYSLGLNQAMLDFVDIDPSKDKNLFLAPYSFKNKQDEWSQQCLEYLISFFQAVLNAIRAKSDSKGRSLLSLAEPNETCLGVSKGRPSGRGVGDAQAAKLYKRIQKSKAARSGFLEDLIDLELFVDGIGRDKISDMTTNIIRKPLIEYTQAQCYLHDIPTQSVPSGKLWDIEEEVWKEEYVPLPVINEKKIILVPKANVRWRRDFSHQKFYNQFVLEFLQDFHINAQSSLVETLKSGKQRVTKKILKEHYPLNKDFLAEFAKENPDVLARYKTEAGSSSELEHFEFDDKFNEPALCRTLMSSLVDIEPGPLSASKYHSLITGIVEFVFYPHLIYPLKENPIHDGRKRVDIRFTNNGSSGFFFRRRTDSHTNANYLFVECKNYSKEIANPELDQLSGRFSPYRGKLGILTCRKFDDKQKFVQRCKDTAKDNRGFIIVIDDTDIFDLLKLIESGRRSAIDQFMENRFSELLS